MLHIGRGKVTDAKNLISKWTARVDRMALLCPRGVVEEVMHRRNRRHTMNRIMALTVAVVVSTGAALAHHGWGSYDAAKPITVAGPILTSKYENPHVTLTVRGSDKVWTVTLAPTSRMINRGALAALVAVGKNISAYGYASTVQEGEMRAERITVDGKTIEMR
jgi:hypothetical protein